MGGIVRRKSPTSESEISKLVKQRLGVYEWSGEILWWSRLQSLKIQHHGHWIQGAKPGTPDYVAVVRNKKLTLSVIFFEIKSAKGRLRPEQKAFAEKYEDIGDIHVFTIRDPKEVIVIINQIAFDRNSKKLEVT